MRAQPQKRYTNLGAVMTYVVSPTRALLVKDGSRPDPLWKLPGGSIESGEDIVVAAIRETQEETGIKLLPGEVLILLRERRENGAYYPNFCIAFVSEEKLETRARVTYESGDLRRPIEVGVFHRDGVPVMLDFLERHRRAIQEADCMVG